MLDVCQGAMELLRGVLTMNSAKLSAKSVSPPEHMKGESAINALSQVIHARSYDPGTLDRPIFDSTKIKKGEWVETNGIVPATRIGALVFSQN